MALDISFLALDVLLYDTRVTPPTGCRLGPDPPPCVFELQLYDCLSCTEVDYDIGCYHYGECASGKGQPVKAGGLKPGLALSVQGRPELRQPMADQGDGRYTVAVDASWVPNRTADHLAVAFFDGATEFSPDTDASGTYSRWDQLRTVQYAPADCSKVAHAVPNATTEASCVCQVGYKRESGTDAGTNASAAALSCQRDCPHSGEEPDVGGRGCRCQAGWYNTTAAGNLECIPNGGYRPGTPAPPALPHNAHCRKCPPGCTDCDRVAGGGGGRGDNIRGPSIAEGWRLNASDAEALTAQLGDAGGSSPRLQLVFRCPATAAGNNSVSDGCPALPLPTGGPFWRGALACRYPHTGMLCGACVRPDYRLRGRSCERCDHVSQLTRDFGLHPLGLLAVGAAAVAAACGAVWAMRGWLARLKQLVFTNLKIVLGLAQVLSLLSEVLDLLFPPQPRKALNCEFLNRSADRPSLRESTNIMFLTQHLHVLRAVQTWR